MLTIIIVIQFYLVYVFLVIENQYKINIKLKQE